jgi:hypothetical protein
MRIHKRTFEMTANTPNNASKLNLLAFIEQLHADQCAWNDKHYKTTTDKLLDLLGRCLEAQMHFAADDKQRRSFFKVFDAMGAIAGKKLSLTSRVVRYVFRITGNRASAYARVIDIALSEKITPAELATWVRGHGGIEEVRRNYAAGEAPAAKQQAKQAAAEDALGSASVICTISNLPQQLHASSDNVHAYSLALVRHDKTSGNGDVLWGTADDTLIKQFLLHQSKRLIEANGNVVTANAHASALASDAAAIDAVLNEIIGSNEQIAA